MSRTTPIAALALLAALLVTGCSSGSATDPSAASDPAAAPSAAATAPSESPSSESAPAASDAAGSPGAGVGVPDRAGCEAVLVEKFASYDARAATDADLQAVADSITLVLPGRPTCGIVVHRSDGPANQLRVIWLDQPGVAPELVRVLDTRGWDATADDTAGVQARTYTDGELRVMVAAMGVDNEEAGWGTIWPGVDISLLSIESP